MDSAKPRRRALVTGASSGIGAAFARELALRGHDLVLAARRLDRIEALAHDLSAERGIDARAIAIDLADPAAPAELKAAIDAEGLAIDVLVNSAGYGVTGSLVSREWSTHAAFLQVMIQAPTELCHAFVPGMRERGFGRVVNVASFAGLMPAPAGHTLYAASKSYLIRFSEALALENRHHGINVCALCPGFTLSEFHDITGSRTSVSKMPKWVWLDARDVARDGLDAAERGTIVRVVGMRYRLVKALFKLLPDALSLKLIAAYSGNFRVVERNRRR
ncbi:MAG TPA: SDR family oxidoreductase [Rhodanobacteraceae bacterium]|nr:SDR family oxidoreductase [Rhodanobacteraceae bacterium]